MPTSLTNGFVNVVRPFPAEIARDFFVTFLVCFAPPFVCHEAIEDEGKQR